MTVKQAIVWATIKLQTSASPNLDAEVLLSYVLEKSREYLYTHPQKELSLLQKIKFKKNIAKRALGVPVAYITHVREFFGFDFYVDKNVLVPRPETEMLVAETIKLATPGQLIADIGTGSGCIAIALAKNLKNKIIATDISPKALKIAMKNAEDLKVNIDFISGDLLNPVINQKIDLLIANLPYGSPEIWENNDDPKSKALKFEPNIALYAKDKGLESYQRLFEQIADLKHRPTYILIEIDPSQPQMIAKIIKKYFPQSKIEIKKDLASLDRVLIAKL